MVAFRVPSPRSPRWRRPAVGLYNFNVQLSRSSDGGSETGSVNSRTRDDGNGVSMYTISIPKNVLPGEEFQVMAGSRIVRVRCPSGFSAGQCMRITVPNDENGGIRRPSSSEQPPDSDGVTRVPQQELAHGESAAYMVRIPEGVRGGQDFPVTINGHHLTVTCPNSGRPGMCVRVVPPSPEDDCEMNSLDRMSSTSSGSTSFRRAYTNQSETSQMFEVEVPEGVKPGHPFAISAGGVRVLVTCPRNASSGQKIRFQLPKGLLNRPAGPRSKLAEIKLSYDKDGWTRTVRASDMKFVWTRFDEEGNVEERTRFDTERSAYVLRLDFTDDCHHLREGLSSLVTPDWAVVDSNVRRDDGSDLVTYSDIAAAQVKSYAEKVQWFRSKCDQLRVHRDEGEMKINIRREYLLGDSIDAIMSLSRKDLRKTWRFEYIGEAGIDVGGLKTEWFQLVTEAMFDPQFGLWRPSTTNQMCMQINPASELCCQLPEDHLLCFRFLGRVMGKALFDKELVMGHMVKHIYKHMLGFPVMLKDLNDEIYSKSLLSLKDMGPDVEDLCVDFTVTEELLGMKKKVELIPGGENISLTEDNLPEYIEACLKYRLLGQCEKQMNELLLGFSDVIESPLLTIFDFQELELLMCGLPTIDLGDWIEHTEYMGEYEMEGRNHEVCNWFWEVVSEYDQEMKARLLQFVTGTSGVPALGFGFLQGTDGNIRNFTIHGVDLDTCVYPRSHTCFNRIDLPLYGTRAELEEKLKIAITMAATGFDIE